MQRLFIFHNNETCLIFILSIFSPRTSPAHAYSYLVINLQLYSMADWSVTFVKCLWIRPLFSISPGAHRPQFVSWWTSKEYVHLKGKRGGGGRFFTQIEPNWPLPYSTVSVPWLRDARAAGWVTYCSMREYNAESQKRADKGSILL